MRTESFWPFSAEKTLFLFEKEAKKCERESRMRKWLSQVREYAKWRTWEAENQFLGPLGHKTRGVS